MTWVTLMATPVLSSPRLRGQGDKLRIGAGGRARCRCDYEPGDTRILAERLVVDCLQRAKAVPDHHHPLEAERPHERDPGVHVVR